MTWISWTLGHRYLSRKGDLVADLETAALVRLDLRSIGQATGQIRNLNISSGIVLHLHRR